MFWKLFIFFSIQTANGALVNWSTLNTSTLDELKKEHSYVVLTEKNCTVCDSYLNELISCPLIPLTKISVVTAGDDIYLRKLRKKLPAAIQLYKTTQKYMARVTKLTPTTFVQNKKIDGYVGCSQLTNEVLND